MCSMRSTVPARSNWNWCRKATWPSASAPQVPALAVFCPTAYGTQLAEGKETRIIDGKPYVFELPLTADYALIKALRADRWGNLVYRKTARNFGPVMAMAAKCTIAQVSETVELGELDPEHIVTPGIFVKRVVQLAAAQPAKEAA